MTEAQPWSERVLRVVDHLHSHLDEDLAPEQLAAIAGFSLHHFHRVFRGMTGESVMGFVRRLRLERAAQRLKFGQEPVTEVALSSGYGSHEAFTRAFRSRFGASPSGYRAEQGRELPRERRAELRQEPERVVLALRYVGSYDGCSQAWDELMQGLLAGGTYREPLAYFGLCYDDPAITAPERLRYDACVVLPGDTRFSAVPPRVVRRTIAGGRYAVMLHAGSYEALDETYVALLGGWLPVRGVELYDEPVVERYLNLPVDTPPGQLRTEVCVRVA